MEQITTDIVIIGGGGGGIRAAIAAAEQGSEVFLIAKGKPGRSGASLLAGAGVSADMACDGHHLAKLGINNRYPDDMPEDWFHDILREGFYLNEQPLVEKYVELAPVILKEMIDWGMKVQGMEGDREISVPSTGMIDSLVRRMKQLPITVISDLQLLDIRTDAEGKFLGCYAWDIYRDRLVSIDAVSGVIATGGAQNMYAVNSGPRDLTGDGIAAAYRAGAEIVDMEIVSFCPTTTIFPQIYKGSIFPYVLATTGYGQLLNGEKKPFIEKYYNGKLLDLALNSEWNKLLLSRAIAMETARCPAPHGGVYYSMKDAPKKQLDSLEKSCPGLKKPPYREMMNDMRSAIDHEIAPAGHYFEGGIRIDESCRTSIPGLFAAGECTGGTFGANRVSAATTEMVVLGLIAGRGAAEYAEAASRNSALSKTDDQTYEMEIASLVSSMYDRERLIERKTEFHKAVANGLGVVRSRTKTEKAKTAIEAIQQDMDRAPEGTGFSHVPSNTPYNLLKQEILNFRNVVECALLTAEGSLARLESRGCFLREDIPQTDNDRELHHIIQVGANGTRRISKGNIKTTSVELPRGKYNYMTFLQQTVDELHGADHERT